MEEFIKNQIVYGLQYLPLNLLKYPFVKKDSAEARSLRKKGYICGVCHPNEDYDTILFSDIEWMRFDIPYPFNADGTETESYKNFKDRCRGYVERGIKVMAVSPFPSHFAEAGYDVTTAEGEDNVIKVARYLITDLQGLVQGIQIANELGIPHFTLPLRSMDEAARFVGITAKVMYPLRKDIIIGYNCAGPQADLNVKMKPWLQYVDYVGIDIYLGCFMYMPGFMCLFDALLDYLWAMTGKPIIVEEFGYMSGGVPRTKKERIEILKKYGVSSEKEAKENIASVMEKIPDTLRRHVEHVGDHDINRYHGLLFKSDLKNHVYMEMPRITKIPGYPHSPEGQADFYEYTLNHFYQKPFVIGSIIYCYQDSDRCYICGQQDCPIETRWGIVDLNGKPKPAYYAVKKVFGKIRGIRN